MAPHNTHAFLYFIQKSNFQIFWGPFPGPQGLSPTIFEFPYFHYITTNFFERFYPLFSWSYSGASDVSTYFYIYTAAPHKTHFPILFPKIKFSKNFGALSRYPGAFAHHFRFTLLPLHDIKFFPSFLPHFFMVLLRRSRRFDLLLHPYGGTS